MIDFLDLKTIFFTDLLSSAVCVLVVFFLWRQNHQRYPGLSHWLLYSGLQFIAVLLLALRGLVPDLISIVLANTVLIGATFLLLRGMERFLGKKIPHVQNFILLAVFLFMHIYFTYVIPNIMIRNINIALGLFAVCFQCAWLMLFRADPELRPVTRSVGVIFIGFCLISLGRVSVELALPPHEEFLQSGAFNAFGILLYQMLSVVLAFSLFLMVNRRLITEQVREIVRRSVAEETTTISLREKEVLLRELYHRTKNNMQVISSLLSLEAHRSSDANLVKILSDMRHRINSMALVHQSLYQSKNLANIELMEYLRGLTRLIADTYRETAERVAIVMQGQPLPATMDLAVPLGLIVNEILSNSFKYAFPDGRSGEIRINLARAPSGEIELAVADNGVGLPPGRELRDSKTLGMQIIFGIAGHQLRARVECKNENGISWLIRFQDRADQPGGE